jgi:dTDP-4-dehydrorhamnose reductase
MVLVTGSRGQLGNTLKEFLGENGFIYTDIETLDITDLSAVLGIFSEYKITAVINCGAYTNVDFCEKNIDLAFKINALGAKNLAFAAEENNAKILHISTDYVFDGVNHGSPYREWDSVNPQNIYGKSKALGEKFVVENCRKYFILRTAWLYGKNGNNFVKNILKLGKEKESLKVVNDQIGNPTNCLELAVAISNILPTDYYGIYHATANGECSWFDFAQKIFEYANISTPIFPCTTEEFPRPAKRPSYSSLDNMMLRNTVGDNFENWTVALKRTLRGCRP